MQLADVIEIPSSPEPPMAIHPGRSRGKAKVPAGKGKTTVRRRARRETVIELTDSESDAGLKFGAGPSSSSRTPSSSYLGNRSQTLQPKYGGSSGSFDNIPPHRRQEKTPAQPRAFPLFLESDQENEPPAPGPSFPLPEGPRAPPTAALEPDPVPHNTFAPITIDVDAPPPETAVEAEAAPIEEEDKVSTVVAQVLEIIPDVQPDHLLALIEQHLPTFQGQVLEHILHILFEDSTYPKVEKRKGKRKSEAQDEATPAKKAKIDYGNKDRVVQRGEYYSDLSLTQLQVDFPYIPKPYLRRQLALHNTLYAPTYLFLAAQEKRLQQDDNVDSSPYSRKVIPYTPAKGKGKAPAREDPEFEAERAWILEQQQEENPAVPEEEEYEDNGDGIECGCCFSTYPFEKMVQCPEAHLFCVSCISTYASSKLGSHDANLVCVHQSGCTLPFPESELRRFLPEKLMALYERVKQQKEVEAAGLEGLEECPFCEWKCVIENEQERLFRCGNEDGGCGVVSCRGCKKLDHLPKSCKEMEEDKHLDGRHAIEEAMTRALMRNCPKCNKAFIKEMGCNKMTCPNCQTLSCYICRKVINSYDHFNQAPPGHPSSSKNADKCILWDPVEQRHADEVKAAAEKALAQYKLDHPEADEDQIKVDLPPPPPPPPTQNPYAALHPGIVMPPMLPMFGAYPGNPQALQLMHAQALEANRHRQLQHMAQANIRVAQQNLERQTREVEQARQAEQALLLAPADRTRRQDEAYARHKRDLVMDRAAAEIRMQRAREAVDAARVAMLELEGGGLRRQLEQAAERERLRAMDNAAAVGARARVPAKPRAKRARR